jgi:hypothetical protein
MINFGALSVFELANAKSSETYYDLVVMSENGGAVRNSFGMEISTKPLKNWSSALRSKPHPPAARAMSTALGRNSRSCCGRRCSIAKFIPGRRTSDALERSVAGALTILIFF